NGDGVPKDYTEAVKWSRKAAEQGNAMAQYNLGLMYAKGDGVLKDYATAYMWVNLAAATGSEKSAKGRDLLAERMTKEQIAEGQKLSREWLERKAKENGE
ncbi:sel1 repeat family protein, partial [bacterium]|nr:sel1 repeat family protein [bacterium]